MKSEVLPEAVVEALGDKVVGGLVEAINGARDDLTEYRALKPEWVADHSPVGLANWINDRLWAQLGTALQDLGAEVTFRQQGHLREVMVDTRFRLRMKRHDIDGRASTSPTTTAIDFYDFDAAAFLPGLEQMCLSTGYIWDKDTYEMGAAVIALSPKINAKAIWVEPLPGQDGLPARLRTWDDGPSTPLIETQLGLDDETAGEQAT